MSWTPQDNARDRRTALDEIASMTGKDMGDFGGWHGLKDYLFANYNDNEEVMVRVSVIEMINVIDELTKGDTK